MTFSISSRLSSLDPYQPSTASRADMGVSGWYPGWYRKCHVLISMYQSDKFTCLSWYIFIVDIIKVIVFIILYQSDQFTCLFRSILYNYWLLMRSTHDYADLVNDWLTEANVRGESIIDQVGIVMSRLKLKVNNCFIR